MGLPLHILMARKKGPRPRHIPQRTCVGCREHSPKRDLLRLVRTPDGVFADPSGKMNGRGAYVHGNQECLQKALKGHLEKALRASFTEEDHQRLAEFGADLAPKRLSSETNIEA